MTPKFYKNLRFQKKVFSVCLLVSLIPVIILGTFCYRQILNLLTEREQTALTDTLIQESNTLHSQLLEYENVMDYIIWNENITQTLNRTYDNNFDMYLAYRDTLDPLFATMKALNTDVERITIYTDLIIHPHGTTLRPLEEIDNAFWYFDVLSNYKTFWLTSMENQQFSLIRQFYHVLEGHTAIIKIDIHYPSAFSSLNSLYEHSYGILLTDADGIPVYQWNTDDMSEHILESRQLEASASDRDIQNSYISESAYVEPNGWHLYLYRPAHTISSPAKIISRTVFIIVIFCLGCIILLGSVLSSSIVRPLEHLNSNIQQVAQGTFDVTVTYDSPDEIGCLIKNFRSMVDQINHLINELLRGKILQQEHEMRALQAQINPHFLYNALSLINSKAILTGQMEIGQMAQFLSTFYRTSLNKGKNLISVRDELENVRSYVNIQLLMHSNSFDAVYEIQEDILSLSMINLLLQPLVENAVIHGIDHRQNQEKGLLVITGCLKNDTLVFQIRDNGPGIPSSQISSILASDSDGYGVQNVHSRVQLFYGKQYGLCYQSPPGSGTTVTLTIPRQPLPENVTLSPTP